MILPLLALMLSFYLPCFGLLIKRVSLFRYFFNCFMHEHLKHPDEAYFLQNDFISRWFVEDNKKTLAALPLFMPLYC